jgi:ribosomal protein S18 acetylase RimI-like enzyme
MGQPDYSHIQFHVYDWLNQENSSDLSRPLDLEQLQHLLQSAVFWARDRRLEDLQSAILSSRPVVAAWDGDRLIGFSRALSDGVYRATIWDVVVHPDYQGAGLGRKLVETILSHPHVNRAERIYLMTTHQQSFYERIGFEQNYSTTMVITGPGRDYASSPANARSLSQMKPTS